MKEHVKSVLQIGLGFVVVVVFLDFLLISYPALNWIVLTLVFFLVAVMILDLLARHISNEKQWLQSKPHAKDDLLHLEGIVNGAIKGDDAMSRRVLHDRLQSIALGAIAAKTRLTKTEILELAENNPAALREIIKDNTILGLIVRDPRTTRFVNYPSVEELLSRIEAWS
jgi:hypothetical protein